MNIFNKLYSRSFYKITKFCFYSNIQHDYENNIKLLKTANYKSFKLFNTECIDDVHISESDWKTICSDVCNQSTDSTIIKRLPMLLINKFKNTNKDNILDSFLSFMIRDSSYHDPYTLLSISGICTNQPRKKYLNQFLNLYEEAVNEKEFEVLFPSYIQALLVSDNRKKALNIINSRKPNESLLFNVILTSPETETWSDLRKYVDEYLIFTNELPLLMEKSIFSKLSNQNWIFILKDILELLNNRCHHLRFETINTLENLFDGTRGFKLTKDSVKKSTCSACQKQMPRVHLEKSDCNELADLLMRDVMQVRMLGQIDLVMDRAGCGN